MLFYLYLTNLILLIVHEIDSAYWKEWDLFKLKGGKDVFLLLHFPLLFVMILGLVWIREGKLWGLILSLLLAASGIFAWFIHSYFLRKGNPEFDVPLSKAILWLFFAVSMFQGIFTLKLFWQ